MNEINKDSSSKDKQDRLERLRGSADDSTKTYNPKYSKTVRRLQIILPLIAACIMAVVFSWGSADKNLKAIQEAAILPSVGKNELLNPRFESKDEKNQPYTITAKRALQGETNEDLVILEEPVGDILLESGSWVAVKAKQGAFRQDNKRLLLKEDVEIYHDMGYEMTTSELNVNMENNSAWTEVDVFGKGPEGTIEGKGMQAESINGTMIFTGPAKLVLVKGGTLGGMFGE